MWGMARLDRVRRRASHATRSSGQWRSAATSSIPPGPTATGHSEQLLGAAARAHPDQRLYAATKIPPKNAQWPARPEYPLDDVFPPDHIRAYTEKSLENLGLPRIDLIQFHVWNDAWADDDRWQHAVDDAETRGADPRPSASASTAGSRPTRMRALAHRPDRRRAGHLQHLRPGPRGRAVPAVPRAGHRRHRPRAIRRRDADRHLTLDTRWPEGDWRNTYFVQREPRARASSAPKRCARWSPPAMTMARWPCAGFFRIRMSATVIPGMRKSRHVEANLAASDRGPLPADLMAALRPHRWDRRPAPKPD